MRLMTKKLEARFKKIGTQDDAEDPIMVAKFFNPIGAGDWFASGYNPKTKIFFGYVSIFRDHCDEWGSFSLEELESIRLKFELKIERDISFKEKPFSEVKKELYGKS